MVVFVTPHLIFGVVVVLAWAVISRVAYVLVNIWFGTPSVVSPKRGIKTLVVLGSGGHTAEMLKLTQSLQPNKYKPLVFVVAATDPLSRVKLENVLNSEALLRAQESERLLADDLKEDEEGDLDCDSQVEFKTSTEPDTKHNLRNRSSTSAGDTRPRSNVPIARNSASHSIRAILTTTPEMIIENIPRSREVGQSYFTSIFTFFKAQFYSFFVVWRHKPDLILVNGPGTCVPICFSGLFLRILGLCEARITFVESLCRVRSLSLAGKLLYWITDDFIVQWPELKEKYPGSKYLGRLV